MAKEGGGIKNITQSGSGNAVTDMTLSSDGKTITAVFGETFARQQDLGTLNNTVTQLSNKLNNFLEGSDADNIINKWKELEAFLDGLTESDNLAELLALKADKTITISAGTGLTGGGNLSANRTLSLATTGVKAGTYTKVTVDTYGRVTVGDNPTTLAGYGITDAVTLTTAQTISGRKTFSQNIVFNNNGGITYPDGNVALRNSDGHTILASFGDGSINLRPNGHNNTEGAVWINKVGNVQAPSVSTNAITIGDAQLVYDSVNKALRVKHRTDGNTVGFYSDGWVSALGVKTGGSGSGSGVVNTVYSFANLTDGTTFSDSDLDNTFNAYTIKKLYDMAGQGGLDADAMWAELKKADSSKIIDASHIPTSVLDGRWVKKTGDTMTGTLTSASSPGSIVFKGLGNCDITNIYKDNGVIRNDDGGLTSIRNGLRFNWYDTYWYIGNLRGGSTDSAGFGVVDHNNKLVLRVTPNDVRAPRFMSTVATGLSPLIVSSNTTVDNLSADLLDGYHAFGTSNALIKYGYTVGGTEPAWCRIATYSIRNTETMTDVCFVLHSAFSDLFGLLVVKTRGTAVVEGLLIASYNINRLNIRIYHDAEKKNIELYCYGGSNYSIIQANLLYSHDRNGGANTNITLYRADTKAPSWSTYVNPGFVNLQNSSEAAKKLQTPRTLWGQSFDGTANVSGDMTGVGSITMSGDLKIGNGTSPNTIYFYGTTGDGPGTYNHTFIAERLWGGTESSELVLFKGNDLSPSDTDATTVGGAGPDRIRHIAAAHLFQTYARPISGTVESICTSSALRNLFSIAPGRVVSYIPLQSIVASGTAPFIVASNTVVGNLNADMVDGLHLSDFDGRYVKKAGDTMTGDLNISGGHILYMLQTSSTSTQQIHFQGGRNDYGRIAFGGTAENAGWMEIASCDDGNEPIYARQYTGVFTTIKRTATLLDASGNTSFPGSVTSVRHISTVGTGTQPYQCNSTTLNTNLNADLLDNWHIMDIPRNYNSTATYSLQFALGSTDNGWKKIFACSESGAGPYRSVTVWGRIWYAYGNYAQEDVRYYHFCAIFRMRGGPSASDSNVGNVLNSAHLYLPTFAKGMDNIRLVRVGTNNFELQVRQISSWHNGYIQYQYFSSGANVSAWRDLQSTSNTTVAVSAGGASTLVDSRASSADVWTSARTFYIQDHNASHTGAGISVNGSSNVYLKLPSSIQCSDWFRSTGNSGWYHQNYGGGIYMEDSTWIRVFGGKRFYVPNADNSDFSTNTAISTDGGIYAKKNITSSANIFANGAITAKASSSDIRLKTDIQGYDAMGIIRKFRSVKYHWNAIAKENSEVFNHDNWNYGLIAQDLLSGGYTQWVKDIFNDYYTIDYERLIPVVWKGLQEVDDEVTRLKKRVRELEKRLGINN